MHNLALFWWVGGSACRVLLLPFLVKSDFARNFKRGGARAKTDGAHCLPGAIIKRDVLWAGSPVPLPMLATWSQSILYLAEAPSDEGDRTLVHLLGDAEPSQAYVAPLESGGRVVALLYADNLPEDGPLQGTEALEVVLHEAGLALDRAALERQLAEAEADAH